MHPDNELTIVITSGHGSFIGINRHCDLMVCTKHQRLNLGPLTQKRAKELGEYLQRLATYIPER